MKKLLLSFGIAALSTSAFAQIPSAPAPTGGDIVALEKYIGSVYQEAINWVVQQNSQPIPHSSLIQTINTTQTTDENQQPQSPEQAATSLAKKHTSDNLSNSLTAFPYALYQNTSVAKTIKTIDGKQSFSDYMNENSIIGLTQRPSGKSFDSLYLDSSINPGLYADITMQDPQLKKPSDLSNDFLDFGALFSNNSYSPSQQHNAKEYVKYAAESTTNFASGLDLKALANQPRLVSQLVNSDSYAEYQYKVRTLLAIRSILINSLNHLIAERTPMKGLGAAAGLAANTPASPLQVEAFRANRRAENLLTAQQKQLPKDQQPNWYTTVENASPATVQRETLIVLAEIEQQNYQAHLDRERILAAITALGLQNNMTKTKHVTETDSAKVKNEVIKLIKQQAKQ